MKYFHLIAVYFFIILGCLNINTLMVGVCFAAAAINALTYLKE